jgi:O-antigen ligase
MLYAAAFVLFCLVCTILAFVRHPIYGLYFYLATTFVFPPGRWWGYIFQDLRWALLSAVVTVLAVVFHRGKLSLKPLWLANAPAILLLMYAAWMWLQTPWAMDISEHLEGSSRFVKYLLAFWFVYRVIDSKERLRDLLLTYMLGCTLLGTFAQFTGREGGRLDGVGGPGIDDANTLGMYLVTGAIVAVGLFLTQTGWRRYVSLVAMVIIINGFVLANSRGSFLGLVAGIIVLAFCMAKQHRWLFSCFALAGGLCLTVIVDQVFIERMFSIQDVTSQDDAADMSARSRVEVAKAQVQMFLDYPMGTGYRGTAVLSARYLDRKWLTLGDDETAARSSHNTFMTALVEQGVPGALMFTSLVLWTVAAMFRIRRLNGPHSDPVLTTLGGSLCGALTVVLVAGNTADYLLAENQFWFYAALVSVFWLSECRNEGSRQSGGAVAMRQLAA